ncbi:MAG: nucleotidyl transferase AbiEii/AbiGii toxin family protein [Verrucomicrobiota bacterium]|nr:nucleotidyl transferase AbiEii/AbiGii toxin family protein [Verrucomicrobiota bacterium]
MANKLSKRLQTIAKEKSIPFNSCWKQLLLERFLVRLGHSPHANKLVFKGGFLLAYLLKIGRETVDLDFLLTRMKAEKKALEKMGREIATIPIQDGFTFSFAGIELLSQPHMDYPGYRVTFDSLFAKMKDKIYRRHQHSY